MAPGEIIIRLDAFIRKYYLNQLIRGLLLGSALILAVFLLFSLSEYFGHFPSAVRATMFWAFMLGFLAVMWFWVIVPLAGMYRLRKTITHEQAAVIIGTHFAHVQDKLLNLIQLGKMADEHPDSALLAASVSQRTQELRPVPFAGAINLKANRRYLRYLAIPVAAMAAILLFESNIIADGTQRLFKYNQHFARKAPFEFLLLNRDLNVARGGQIKLRLQLKGRAVPDEAYVVIQGQRIKMSQAENGEYVYELNNILQATGLHFEAASYSSGDYNINLIPVPSLTDAELWVAYPAYTGKQDEKLVNTGELLLPAGSRVTWKLSTRDAAEVLVNSEKNPLKTAYDGRVSYTRTFLQPADLSFMLQNGRFTGADTLRYNIRITEDERPAITAETFDDSANIRQFWFAGQASDDYGISRIWLQYRYAVSTQPGKVTTGFTGIPLIIRQGVDVAFSTGLNIDAIGMAAGDEVEYYFEAWDNDAVHGPKSSRTAVARLRRKSIEEVRKEADVTGSKVQQMMSGAFEQHRQMQKEAEELRQMLNSRKNMSWEDKQRVEDFMQKQEKLDEKLEQLRKEQEQLQKQQNEFQPQSPEALEKKQQMDELFKDMKNPEMQKLMEEIQKLLEKKASKEEISRKLEEMQQQHREQAKDMKQLMEQFKELQLEQKMNDNIERLNKLAEQQEKLAAETQKQKGDPNGKLAEQQEKLNKELEAIRKEVEEAQKMNEELEKPMKLDMAEEEQRQAGEEQKEAGEELSKGKNNKAGESQKNAASQMKKAAERMQKSLEQEQQKRLSEDYQKIRELLENLVEASFEQETIFTELGKIREYNPRFVELNKRQMVVREKCALLEDSLRVLARRQPMVSTFITKEISRINTNMDAALESLRVRHIGEAGMREQYVMTGLNNLAVMLLESMQNMQQKMSQQNKSKGNQSCSNPGGKGQGKGKPKNNGKLSQSQEQLGQMLQEMQRKGQQNKPGQQGQPKPGQQGDPKETNREYARIALMQEALRRQLSEMRQALEKQGNGAAAKELQRTEQLMEQQERDMVNKRLTPEQIKRQKEIETRLLEHEKAELTQQMEEKRESASPTAYTPTAPPELQAYLREKKRERELLRTSPPELTPYYREKVKTYLQKIN